MVERVEPGHLRLRAEVRTPGSAWLAWNIEQVDDAAEVLQRARFVPRGIWGRVYWYTLVPVHQIRFPPMAPQIRLRAERLHAGTRPTHDPDAAGAER